MKSLLRVLLVLLAVMTVCNVAQVGSTFDYGSGGWGGWNSYGLGCGYGASVYGLGRVPVPPYYAIHPPVYYGNRVRRSYGDSPYAEPASRWVSERSSPVIIINPFVQQAGRTDSAVDGVQEPAKGAQIIENPYFKSGATP